MGSGKFFPGGSKKDKTPKGPEIPAPIRAEEPKKRGLFPGSRSRFSRPLHPDQRPGAAIIGMIFCVIFISIGWYYGGVRPARLQAKYLAEQLELMKKQHLEEQKKIEELRKVDAQERVKSARAMVKLDTRPAHGKIVLGDVTKIAPAIFEGIVPGKVTLTISVDGYRTVTKEVILEGDQTADLGLIELVARSGGIKMTSPQSGVAFTLSGPNNFYRSGTLPASFDRLPEGDYTVNVTHKGWQVAPATLTVVDGKEAVREFKFGYGSITLQSDPPGATVYRDRTVIGQTPLVLSELRPGLYRYTIEKEGYRIIRVQQEVKEFAAISLNPVLEKTRDFTNATGLAMVWIPSGYWVGKYEVTQSQFEKILGHAANPSTFHGANRPVESITWQQALDFCQKLTQAEQAAGKLPTDYKYSLPTEVQFNEYLADADPNTAVMAYSGSPAATADVGSSDPNSFGLYDVLGNVWEWCLDNFDPEGRAHVMRGGGWLSTRESFPNKGTRNGGMGAFRDKFTGFRVVLVKSP
jgi:hypothetical protein